MNGREYNQMRHWAVLDPNPKAIERLSLLLSDWADWQGASAVRSLSQAQQSWPALSLDLVFIDLADDFTALDWALAHGEWTVVAMCSPKQDPWPLVHRGLFGCLFKPFRQAEWQPLATRIDTRISRQPPRIWLHRGGEFQAFEASDLCWINASREGVQVMTLEHGAWVSTQSAGELLAHLPDWISVRRGWWAAPQAIWRVYRGSEGAQAWLAKRAKPLPVARRAYAELRRRLARI